MYIVELKAKPPHLNLIRRFEFKSNLIIIKHEPCDLYFQCQRVGSYQEFGTQLEYLVHIISILSVCIQHRHTSHETKLVFKTPTYGQNTGA